MTCPSEDNYYSGKNKRCCERCPAGTYVKEECTETQKTKCDACANGQYTATKNSANRCHQCNVCSSDNKQQKVKDCTRTENTVCRCIAGYFCSNDNCDHCQLVDSCPPGKGVKTPATRTHNTICAECETGTYSNVTDFSSPCKPHTRCEDFGRTVETPGTRSADAVCGGLTERCSWVLPAGLWAGLVLTALILFAIVICRKAKRKSYRAGSLRDSPTLVQVVPVTSMNLPLPATSQDSPLCFTKLDGHYQETCSMTDFNIFPQDELDSSLPITPLKASISFAEPSYVKNSGYCTNDYLGIQSEPQEDEWCGT